MLVGHFAVAVAAKSAEPKLSLGTLALAAMTADLLGCAFMLAGIERVEFKPGIGAANYFVASEIAMSHSLLMDVIWAAVFAAVYWLKRRYWRGAWVLLAVVLSHWVLDWVSHKPDLPLAPGVHAYFGLGLWTSVRATLVVEGILWLIAIVLYIRATETKGRTGVYVFGIAITILTLAWYNNVAGPPTSNPKTAPISSLIFFSLAVAWAYWMNHLRPVRLEAADSR